LGGRETIRGGVPEEGKERVRGYLKTVMWRVLKKQLYKK
jgi:hypothetical protein